MKTMLVLLGFLGLATVAAAATLTFQAPVVVVDEPVLQVPSRPGPDAPRLALFLDALEATDPALCEMIADQVGNTWSWGGDLGVGLPADTRMGARAAKDSLSGRVEDPAAIQLLQQRLSAPDPCVRRTAARLLGRSTVDDGTLTTLLSAPNEVAREAALLAAGSRDRPALRPRVEALLRDGSPSVASMAAWSLGQLEAPESVDPLVGALRSPAPRVRTAAAWALGQIEDVRAVRPLIETLGDGEAPVRLASAEALADIESPDAVEALERVATRDADRRVRKAAIDGLGSLELSRSALVLDEIVSGLDLELAVAAAEAIGNLDDLPQAPPGLVRAAGWATNDELRWAALEALTDIEDPATATTLMAAVSDPEARIRRMVIQALGDLEVAAATDVIRGALTDPDPGVRRAAVRALAEIEDRN